MRTPWNKADRLILILTALILAGLLAFLIVDFMQVSNTPSNAFQVDATAIDYQWFGTGSRGILYFDSGRVVPFNKANKDVEVVLNKPATWYFEEWGSLTGRILESVEYR